MALLDMPDVRCLLFELPVGSVSCAGDPHSQSSNSETAAAEGEAAPADDQFNSLLKKSGLRVRTATDSVLPSYALYGHTNVPHYPVQYNMPEGSDPGAYDPQPQIIDDQYGGAQRIVGHPDGALPSLDANSSAVGTDPGPGAGVMRSSTTNEKLNSALTDRNEYEEVHAPHELEHQAQGTKQLKAAEDETGGVVVPGVGALAGLAGMIGWGRNGVPAASAHSKSPSREQNDVAADPSDSLSAAQPLQQLPGTFNLTGPDLNRPEPSTIKTPSQEAEAGDQALGGFSAAFARFMRESETPPHGGAPDAPLARAPPPSLLHCVWDSRIHTLNDQ
jgi:hypothetical protein